MRGAKEGKVIGVDESRVSETKGYLRSTGMVMDHSLVFKP